VTFVVGGGRELVTLTRVDGAAGGVDSLIPAPDRRRT